MNRTSQKLLLATAAAATLALFSLSNPQYATAGGFELPENTTKSVARGGTGVVMKRDPSALYFNPALLPRARGFQALANVNLVDLNLEFQRDPLIYQLGTRTERQDFEPVQNNGGWFPAPFAAVSWDFGIENFAVALGAFGPSAYGAPCIGNKQDGDCLSDGGAARNMVIGSDLLVAYFSAGAGYQFNNVFGGQLSIGLTAMAAYLNTSFSSTFDADMDFLPPWQEDSENEAIFYANELTDWAPTGIIGLAYARDGFRLGASYRPPIKWEAKGKVTIDFPAYLNDLGAALNSDELSFNTWHAGSLRLGVGYEGGEHPGRPELPRFDIELNATWEDWSRVEHFHIVLGGDVALHEIRDPVDDSPTLLSLNDIYQPKNYQDVYSLRLGSSYAFLPWLSGHAGGYFETAGQPDAYTNVDFVSWQRFAAGLGATLHLGKHFDLDLAYSFIGSPSRTVTDGGVHNLIPLSSCTGPDYNDPSCPAPGTPPGNPQNNGTWSTYSQIASVGVTVQY